MIIHINEIKECCICGKSDKKLQSHHALPKHLNPVNNVIVQICEPCHERLNAEDITGMYSYLHRIEKMTKENLKAIKIAYNNLDYLAKIKFEKSKK